MKVNAKFRKWIQTVDVAEKALWITLGIVIIFLSANAFIMTVWPK